MKKQEVAKITTGTIVLWSFHPGKWAYKNLGVFIEAVDHASHRPWSSSPRVPGARLYGITGHGTKDNPFKVADGSTTVVNRCVLDVVGKPPVGTSPVEYVQALKELSDARDKRNRSEARAEAVRVRDESQAKIDWLRSFGLTVSHDCRYAIEHKTKDDGYGSDVALNRDGSRVTLKYDDLVGLLQGPAE